jgi:hypothetical protein
VIPRQHRTGPSTTHTTRVARLVSVPSSGLAAGSALESAA